MNTSELKIVKLGCVSCGSNLEISTSMTKLACGYCGTSQTVERKGGAIHLKGIEAAISKVQVGTDKTAAELAIVRIGKELQDLKAARAQREYNWTVQRNTKLQGWHARKNDADGRVAAVSFVAGLVGALPAGLIAWIAYRLTSAVVPAAGATLIVIFLFLGLCVGVGYWISILMRKSDRYNKEKLNADFQSDIAAFDSEIRQDLRRYDQQIKILEQRMQKNYEIANA